MYPLGVGKGYEMSPNLMEAVEKAGGCLSVHVGPAQIVKVGRDDNRPRSPKKRIENLPRCTFYRINLLASDSAITSPMITRPRVDRLLRDGRSLTDPKDLDSHYRLVTEAVLEDVPFVHPGFARNAFIYSTDRVALTNDASARETRSLASFIPAAARSNP